MRVQFVFVAGGLAVASNAWGQSKVVITEIMYNPASNESRSETEWVEIANVGTEPIEIKDWRLDDEDKGDWGKFSCTLAPGGVVVLVNDKAVTEAAFRAAWDQETNCDAATPASSATATPVLTYQVIPVRWQGLANTPTAENEILQLLNEKNEVVCEVNFQEGGDWPTCKKPDGSSIWLADVNTSNFNDGKLWHKSETAKHNARSNRKTAVFNGTDIGSPGVIATLTDQPLVSGPAPADPVGAKSDPDSGAKDVDEIKDRIDY